MAEDLKATLDEMLGTLNRMDEDDPARPPLLGNLGNLMLTLFERTGRDGFLDAAVLWYAAARAAAPLGDPTRGRYAANQATALLDRFHRSGSGDDLDTAVERITEALALAPEGHPDRAGRLHTLGGALRQRFQAREDPADLEESVRLHEEALTVLPPGSPHLAALLTGAGNAYKTRFGHHGRPADLDAAVGLHLRALAAARDGEPRAAALSNIGTCLLARARATGDPGDLREAVRHAEECLAATPESNPHHTARAANLALALLARYERHGAAGDSGRAAAPGPEDLDRAITLYEHAVEVSAAGDALLPAYLGGLGGALHTRHRHRGVPGDLDRAVEMLRAAAASPLVSPGDRGRWLNNLGNALRSRYDRDDDPRDLEEAVTVLTEAADTTPDGHPKRAMRLHNLATALNTRLWSTDDPDTLARAVECYAAALRAASPGDRVAAVAAGGLGSVLSLRFTLHGDADDLAAAVGHLTRALTATGEDDPDRPTWLAALGGALINRYQHAAERTPVDQAIVCLEASLAATPDGHPDLSLRLRRAGFAFALRFERFGDPGDAQAAVARCERATRVAGGPGDRAYALFDLGIVLLTRYNTGGREAADLDRAEEALDEALALLPEDHSARMMLLRTLGIAAHLRFQRTGEPADAGRAVDLLERAAGVREGFPGRPDTTTLAALAAAHRACSRSTVDPAGRDRHRARARETGLRALETCQAEVLLQSTTADGLAVTRRLASDALTFASWCLEDGAPADAVRALELGRGLLRRAATTTGTVADRLRAAGARDLAGEWDTELTRAARRVPGATPHLAPQTAPDFVPAALRHRALRVLAEAPGAEALAATVPLEALHDTLTRTGADALVYLLPGTARRPGRAVVVRPGRDPEPLDLPAFLAVPGELLATYVEAYNRLLVATAEDAETTSEDTAPPSRLAEARRRWTALLTDLCDWSWTAVMSPLLDAIRPPHQGPPHQGPPHQGPPRLVLVPVGHATLVPWHAARAPAPPHYAVERAVISYAASAALLHETASRGRLPLDGRALVVGNPTHGLTYAEAEARQIHRRCYPAGLHLGPPEQNRDPTHTTPQATSPAAPPTAPPVAPPAVTPAASPAVTPAAPPAVTPAAPPAAAPGATPEAVLECLPGAGTGGLPVVHLACHGTVAADPARSYLALAGGRRLTVERLLAHGRGRRADAPGPLVVLSACMSAMAAEDFDEALTLATAFLVAGAATAIGSLWIVDSRDTADLMTTFHDHLATGSGAAALRAAQLAMLRHPGRPAAAHPFSWAAFFHQGV
ncbi:CHAT domain-containing protein [Sphaerisporangium sp. B11E5]|uniref:CHAT domain-containing protein n=1 Tax=Sphaerisporangium sp. B11E5 TaxID=3153563 RepID=UPI00325C9578